MKYLLTLLISFSYVCLSGQQRLELLETNIPINNFTPYGDSYLWTKNWWLTNGMIIDTTKGGNTFSVKSKLSKPRIDSLSRVFKKYSSPDIVLLGNLTPRIVYGNSKKTPYIKASIYEIEGVSSKLIAAYIIEFGSGSHNKMTDIWNITIIHPKAVTPISTEAAKAFYKRKGNKTELAITPPQVANR